MIIVGCDYPSFQQITFVDTESGELKEQRLAHREGAEEFYRALAAAGQRVRVGMEASGRKQAMTDVTRWDEKVDPRSRTKNYQLIFSGRNSANRSS
jgi:hypothetical protein